MLRYGKAANQKQERADIPRFVSGDTPTRCSRSIPVTATEMGIHIHDGRLTDYSPSSVRQMIRTLKQYEEPPCGGAEAVSHGRRIRLPVKLMKSNVDVALLDLERIAWYKKSPQLYVDDGAQRRLLSDAVTARSDGRETAVDSGAHESDPGAVDDGPAKYPQTADDVGAVVSTDTRCGAGVLSSLGEDLTSEFPNRATEITRVVTCRARRHE